MNVLLIQTLVHRCCSKLYEHRSKCRYLLKGKNVGFITLLQWCEYECKHRFKIVTRMVIMRFNTLHGRSSKTNHKIKCPCSIKQEDRNGTTSRLVFILKRANVTTFTPSFNLCFCCKRLVA